MRKVSVADVVWMALLVVVLAAVAGMMFQARQSVLASFDTPQSQQEWDAWRDSVREGQANMGPVQRKIPRSNEPPTLVLLRDYFAVCLTGILLLTAVLYATLVLFIRGVWNSPTVRYDMEDERPPE